MAKWYTIPPLWAAARAAARGGGGGRKMGFGLRPLAVHFAAQTAEPVLYRVVNLLDPDASSILGRGPASRITATAPVGTSVAFTSMSATNGQRVSLLLIVAPLAEYQLFQYQLGPIHAHPQPLSQFNVRCTTFCEIFQLVEPSSVYIPPGQ